jgi:hypothetical protein
MVQIRRSRVASYVRDIADAVLREELEAAAWEHIPVFDRGRDEYSQRYEVPSPIRKRVKRGGRMMVSIEFD